MTFFNGLNFESLYVYEFRPQVHVVLLLLMQVSHEQMETGSFFVLSRICESSTEQKSSTSVGEDVSVGTLSLLVPPEGVPL